MSREEWADLVAVAAMLDVDRVGGDSNAESCQWADRVEQGCVADETGKGDEWN